MVFGAPFNTIRPLEMKRSHSRVTGLRGSQYRLGVRAGRKRAAALPGSSPSFGTRRVIVSLAQESRGQDSWVLFPALPRSCLV